jgi:VWFA-related protein
MTFRESVVTVLLCLIGNGASAQIRTETRVVLVDTIVTNKQGEYVHDLDARAFRVWEDNKEQTIKSVTLEKGPGAPSRQRYLVLFFARMEPAERIVARRAVSGFIDANAEEDRLMAVVNYSGGLRIGQNFTGDATRLKAAVNGALSSEAVSGEADSGALDTIRALGNLAAGLSVLPGRKAIVFVSGGISQSSVQKAELKAAIDACNKSDVAVYPIDVRPLFSGVAANRSGPLDNPATASRAGRRAPGGPQGQRADSEATIQGAGIANQQVLFRLAGGTGGFVIPDSGELRGGLQKIGEEQSEYYVLSYTPSDSKEGSCHALRVKVDRSGTTVRARANYCESKPQDLLAGTIAGQDLERRAASASTGGIAASMQLSYFYLSPNVARVGIAMEIPAQTVVNSNTAINFLGIASAPDGIVVSRFSDALKLDPDSRSKPAHYEKEFKIVPGRYTFTMAFGSGGESFGKLEIPLTVDPRQVGELAISGIALSKETHPAAELGLGLDGLVEGRTPLIADGVRFVPSSSSQFSKSEAGYFYFEVYAPGSAPVRVVVRVLDRNSGEVKSDSGMLKLNLPRNTGTDTISAGSKLPIGALRAGSYKLEVTAIDSAGKQVRRTADFEVM